MRTDDLIDALAADAGPVPGGSVPRRLLMVGAIGAAVALTLILAWLQLRDDLDAALLTRFFWMKAGYTALLAGAGFWACERLARPLGSGRKGFWLAGAALAVYLGLALTQWLLAPADQRMAMLAGNSVTDCLRNILILGLPMLAASLIALRGLAPAQPTLAGFAAGLFSGALCATVYGLHCGESTMVFVGTWYTLGVLLVGLTGAAIGRWALRW